MLFTMLLVSMLSHSALSSTVPLLTICSSAFTYSPNDQFAANLKRLLDALSSNTAQNIPNRPGFYNTSLDVLQDRVYGQALCRGDISSHDCQECVHNATHYIFTNCNKTDAIIWYELCQVRYSQSPSLAIEVYTGNLLDYNNQENKIVSKKTRFRKALMYLMNNLSIESAFSPSKHMFATGKIEFSKKKTIYGLVQCTMDIPPELCKQCLDSALGDIDACCSFRQGGIVLGTNCNVRFELFQFYNDTKNSPLVYPFPKGDEWKIWKTLVVTCTSILLLAIIIGSCAVYLRQKKGTKRDDTKENALLQELARPKTVMITQEGNLVTSEELPFIDLATIRAATDEFADSNKLGEGGFGSVYKGELPDGTEVAVKRLSLKSRQGLEELKNEVILIAKLQHRNLVRLVGCGIEGDEKLLLYEFMPNGSLDFFIYDSERRCQLNWETYYNIIAGIARGLLYLHEDSRHKIIHRDLKPSNVLLDHDMVAKISDFGMARIFCENQNAANTKKIVGTYGYIAPEYAMGGVFSIKSDVFSFGVILLEIISGKKNSGSYLTEYGHTLLSYAWRSWKDGQEVEFVDPWLMESSPPHEVLRCLHIGLLCVQEDPEDRPKMSEVVVSLRGSESVSLSEPKQPAFALGRLVPSDQSTVYPTMNGLTLSTILPR
ncbi:Cysteine rich receptor like kinase [Parasponia andersonii]|uniref:non-specific serine/threonine protein kinase n=1 Tax=Parasponia andersonii TaxID=3476 RepID=A0A2P5AX11_PARAD|nr:Cysteine rich receptor like kinase [Parasponia andersonii]